MIILFQNLDKRVLLCGRKWHEFPKGFVDVKLFDFMLLIYLCPLSLGMWFLNTLRTVYLLLTITQLEKLGNPTKI